MTQKTLHFLMIKPSHYDDDGYVIQWARSSIPSNTTATIYGLAQDCVERKVLGEIDLKVHAIDETNTRVVPKEIVQTYTNSNDQLFVALVGVQSNQYPRSVDLAKQFVDLGVKVCIGGFHVSGCISMLPDMQPELQEAMDYGISLFAGELEGRLEGLLKDVLNNELKPMYNYMDDLPHLNGQPIPFLPRALLDKTNGSRASFDAGRGCPFKCSFCTIINVQGQKSRWRTADDVERVVRANAEQGIYNFFISDDNFARNKQWEVIFDRLISLKEEGFKIFVIIQVDTLSHKVKGFVEKAAKAGVNRVFIGLENINPESLKGAQKNQNKISEYRTLMQAWHNVGALTYAGYIIGFPGDTPESIRRDIRIIQKEIPVDLLEFFILTPLPGSQDHKELYLKKVEMEKDLNNYDTFHVTTQHPVMSDQELKDAYTMAWDEYYNLEHVERVLRRTKQWGYDTKNMMVKLISFYASVKFEDVHPLDSGLLRKKYRKDRRPGMKIESPFTFYPKFAWQFIKKHCGFFWLYYQYTRIHKKVMSESVNLEDDLAMKPVVEGEKESLELFKIREQPKKETTAV